MKLLLLHDSVKKESILLSSFNDDCLLRYASDFDDVDKLVASVDVSQITHLAFVYHFPGHCRLPFYFDISNDFEQKPDYFYFSKQVIKLFNLLNLPVVDLLSCSLSDSQFKLEVEKLEKDLNIDIRYSIDQTGSGGNWVLESDNVDVKHLYFTDNVDNWLGVLSSDIGPSVRSNSFPSYITYASGLYTLLQDFTWPLPSTDPYDFIGLLPNDVFDGNNKQITAPTDFNSIFTSTGTSEANSPLVKNLGVIGGTLKDGVYPGYLIRSFQKYFKVTNCYSTGEISGQFSGGICGSSAGSSQTNNFNDPGSCLVQNCYSTGKISGLDSGGICGSNTGYFGFCTVQNCYSIGEISNTNTGGICGGAAGFGGFCTVQNCYSSGIISGLDSGGICGSYTGYNAGTCTIKNCFYSGSITGPNSGSICGSNAGLDSILCTVQNCYSSGIITNNNSDTYSGSIVANANYDISTISDTGYTNINVDNVFIKTISNYPRLLPFVLAPFNFDLYNLHTDTPTFINSTFFVQSLFDNSNFKANDIYVQKNILRSHDDYNYLTNRSFTKSSISAPYLLSGDFSSLQSNIVFYNIKPSQSLTLSDTSVTYYLDASSTVSFTLNGLSSSFNPTTNTLTVDGSNYLLNGTFVIGSNNFTVVGTGSQFLNMQLNSLVCLTDDTKVNTPSGYQLITNLKAGDFVLTDDGRKVQIKNIATSHFVGNLNTYPYVIPKNSISYNYPPEDVKVSRSHLIKFGDKWLHPKNSKMFSQDHSYKFVNYYHIGLENYITDNLVINGGTVVESLADRHNISHLNECKRRHF